MSGLVWDKVLRFTDGRHCWWRGRSEKPFGRDAVSISLLLAVSLEQRLMNLTCVEREFIISPERPAIRGSSGVQEGVDSAAVRFSRGTG